MTEEIMEHPEYVVINEALDTLDQMREQFIDLIQGMVDEDDCIDFTEDDKFHEACDRAYACMRNSKDDCFMECEIFKVTATSVISEYGDETCFEDMEAKELLQVYRCLCEYDEWKQTSKISYE